VDNRRLQSPRPFDDQSRSRREKKCRKPRRGYYRSRNLCRPRE
jgi:hypothetical protein